MAMDLKEELGKLRKGPLKQENTQLEDLFSKYDPTPIYRFLNSQANFYLTHDQRKIAGMMKNAASHIQYRRYKEAMESIIIVGKMVNKFEDDKYAFQNIIEAKIVSSPIKRPFIREIDRRM
jgi:hypothetical protein